MAGKVCRGILIATALVAQCSVTEAAAGCPTAGSSLDPSDLQSQITSLAPMDVKPKVPSVGHVDTSIRATGISAGDFECVVGTGKLNWKTTGAATATPAPGVRPSLTRGTDTCYLKAITLKKTSATAAKMFFDYEDCAGASSVADTKATVVVNVQKVNKTTRPDQVVDFVEHLCRPSSVGSQEVAKVKMEATETQRGIGQCIGLSLANYTNIATPDNCRTLCSTDIDKYSPECEAEADEIACMDSKPDLCRGYAYNTPTKECFTYKGGAINQTTGTADWLCKSLDLTDTTFGAKIAATTTAPPPRMVGTMAATKAVVQTFKSKENCFPTFDWITLQEASGADTSFQVVATVWDKFMELFPQATAAATSRRLASDISASLQVDNPSYGLTGAGGVVPPVTPAPATPPPAFLTSSTAAAAAAAVTTAAPVVTKVEAEDCVVPEVLNALLSGVVVPMITWGAVKFYYDRRFNGESLDKGTNVYVLILVSFVAAIIVSVVLVFLVAFILTPMCGSSGHDINIVTISVCMATIAGCAIGLYFIGAKGSDIQSGVKKQKFMMVAVDEDGATTTLKSHEMVHDTAHDTVLTNHATKSTMGRK
jgi:hypothetical protein